MRAGWNPTRRNRNIGTPLRGRGQDNRMVVPSPGGRIHYQVLRRTVAVQRSIHGATMRFLVEPTTPGWLHACTVDDVAAVVGAIAPSHLEGLGLIVLRQPTRKAETLNPVWGRLSIGSEMVDYDGAAVLLDACTTATIRWRKSLDPDDQRELRRLADDGHRIVTERRHVAIERTWATCRNTILFRTLLHEIGHHVDYLDRVERPSGEDFDAWSAMDEAFWARPVDEREAAAHRYATEAAARLRALGAIPFAPRIDPDAMRAEGLEPAWFTG